MIGLNPVIICVSPFLGLIRLSISSLQIQSRYGPKIVCPCWFVFDLVCLHQVLVDVVTSRQPYATNPDLLSSSAHHYERSEIFTQV